MRHFRDNRDQEEVTTFSILIRLCSMVLIALWMVTMLIGCGDGVIGQPNLDHARAAGDLNISCTFDIDSEYECCAEVLKTDGSYKILREWCTAPDGTIEYSYENVDF